MGKYYEMRKQVKSIIEGLSWLINYMPFNNRFRFKGTKLKNENKILYKCKIDCKGNRNTIVLHSGGRLRNCLIRIRGNNNLIDIGEKTSMTDCELWIEDTNNEVLIGNNTLLSGKAHLACIEGSRITIGDNCLFSSDIIFRTGDSHSILDLHGNRINPSKNIQIKNHVWIGNKVFIGKGVTIEEDCVVGTGSIVTKSITDKNVIIAGVPAKVIKQDINWCSERI